jgi:murein L,D-transpeptidase YcbB/YkuD
MNSAMPVLFLLGLLLAGCRNDQPGPAVPAKVHAIVRDTSITPENAFTHLLLDSATVRQFISATVRDSLTATAMIDFYNERNYQFAWFDEEGMSEQAGAFLHMDVDSILNDDSVTISPQALSDVELGLTLHFIQYVNSVNSGKINPGEMKWYIPARKVDPLTALDKFLTGNNKNWLPLGKRYYQLRDKLNFYAAIAKAGGWPTLDIKEKIIKRGTSTSETAKIKQRLQLTGDLAAADSGNVYDRSLEEAVKKAQLAYGLPVNGQIDRALIKELNIPVTERIKQMIINLERMKWMPEEDSSYILANIPEYRLRVYDDDRIRLQMRIVVGRAANNTVIFSDQLKYVVFAPYWNVPKSIVRNEIAPAIKKDKGYLKAHNMEITGYNNGLPVVRQRPGDGNALGKVKFIFPNRFNIYFHDTPARDLFERQERAFSHGCIRLQKPFELAKLLLSGSTQWNDNAIREAMKRRTEKWVTLPGSIPVYIVYFTSWVDDNGLLHFAKDIYGHDREMAGHLFKE